MTRVFTRPPAPAPDADLEDDVRLWASGIADALRSRRIAAGERGARARRSERWSARPTRARGRGFWTLQILLWPVALLLALAGERTLGGGVEIWVGGTVAVAFGLAVLIPQLLVEVDDGDPAG